MDRTEEYCEMCKKAVEIQPGGNGAIGNYYFSPVCDEALKKEIGAYKVYQLWDCALEKPHFWLPRQDQLQEMLWVDPKKDTDSFLLTHMLYTYLAQNQELKDLKLSMENLWLRFVMEELHNKGWTGFDWIEF